MRLQGSASPVGIRRGMGCESFLSRALLKHPQHTKFVRNTENYRADFAFVVLPAGENRLHS